MSTSIHSTGSGPRGLISLKTAAVLVDVDPKTIRNWIAAGQLKGYRLNARMLRVEQSELMALAKPVETLSDGAA